MTPMFARPYLTGSPDGCQACSGAGYVLLDEARGAPCPACAGDRAAVDLFSRARLLPGLLEACVELKPPALRPEEKAAWLRGQRLGERLSRATSSPSSSATGVIYGEVGAGKSWLLASTVTRTCVVERRSAAYISLVDAFRDLRTFGGGDLDRGVRLALLVEFLALDDVGGHRNEAASGLVRDVVLGRHRQALPTLLASREDPEALAGELGRSVADVIRGASISVVLMNGSLRR